MQIAKKRNFFNKNLFDSSIGLKAQYIDGVGSRTFLTNILTEQNILDYKLNITLYSPFNDNGWGMYIGTYDYSGLNAKFSLGPYSGKFRSWWLGNKALDIDGYANQWHKLSVDKNGAYVDDVQVGTTTGCYYDSSVGWGNFFIGVGNRNGGTLNDYAVIKNAQVINGSGKVIMNLVPIKNDDGTGSFYNTVSGVIYSSDTTTKFEVVKCSDYS